MVRIKPTAPQADWQGFITPFTQPAFEGSPYDIIQVKVQTAMLDAFSATGTDLDKHAAMSLQNHWNNFAAGLLSVEVRSSVWLLSSWNTLLERLELCEQPLTEEEKAYAQSLFAQYNLV